MPHVFISYVMEDAKLAAWIALQLRGNGLEPWFSKDPERITPGDDWRRVLRTAIQDGGFYVPLFTQRWAERGRSVANEELMIAAEEARLRPPGRRWFVPVKVDDAELPPLDLGGGRQLADIQYVDVPQLGWERGLKSLMQALGVPEPVLERGEPIAPGFGSTVRVVGGSVVYRNISVPIPELEGTMFTITDGAIWRDEGGAMMANFKLRAPFEQLQTLNEQLGFDSIDVATRSSVISTDPDRPTSFYYVDRKDRREAGAPVWLMGSPEPVRTTVSIDQVTGYEAVGHLNSDDQIVGKFKGFVETGSELGVVKVTFDGDFMLQLKDVLSPPAG